MALCCARGVCFSDLESISSPKISWILASSDKHQFSFLSWYLACSRNCYCFGLIETSALFLPRATSPWVFHEGCVAVLLCLLKDRWRFHMVAWKWHPSHSWKTSVFSFITSRGNQHHQHVWKYLSNEFNLPLNWEWFGEEIFLLWFFKFIILYFI